jgi:hypothetical protein
MSNKDLIEDHGEIGSKCEGEDIPQAQAPVRAEVQEQVQAQVQVDENRNKYKEKNQSRDRLENHGEPITGQIDAPPFTFESEYYGGIRPDRILFKSSEGPQRNGWNMSEYDILGFPSNPSVPSEVIKHYGVFCKFTR